MNRALVMVLVGVAGCTGLTSGENLPGMDTYLESGAIAVDPHSENSFVLSRSADGTRQELFAIPPDTGNAKLVLDVSGVTNVRIVFPATGILVLGERGGSTELSLLDSTSFAVQKTAQVPVMFNQTQISPSGLLDAGPRRADVPSGEPDDLINTVTLERHAIPADAAQGGTMIATWAHGSDELVAVVSTASGQPGANSTIVAWDVNAVASAGFPAGDLWPDPIAELGLGGVSSAYLDSLEAIGVSADDMTWVFPLARFAGSANPTPVLEVFDVPTQSVGEVPNARGPVGFTPDDATIVSYRDDSANANVSDLLLVGRGSLDASVVPLPGDIDLPSFFVSHAGNLVLVTQALGTAAMVLYDVDNQQLTHLAGPQVELDDFVSSGTQRWVPSAGLYRVDLAAQDVTSIPLTWTPSHINILPTRNLLVLDDSEPRIHFVDPLTLHATRMVPLPSP